LADHPRTVVVKVLRAVRRLDEERGRPLLVAVHPPVGPTFRFLELGQILGYGVGEPELALLHQDEDDDRGHRLRRRGEPEDRVLRHRPLRFDVHQPVRFEVDHPAASRDRGHRARDVLRLDVADDHFVDALEALGGEPDLVGLGRGQRGAARVERTHAETSAARNVMLMATDYRQFGRIRTVAPVETGCV
jgi:hypothetical protein